MSAIIMVNIVGGKFYKKNGRKDFLWYFGGTDKNVLHLASTGAVAGLAATFGTPFGLCNHVSGYSHIVLTSLIAGNTCLLFFFLFLLLH
jgi:hypothetical protein